MNELIFLVNFDPVALDLGFWQIRWYSLAYAMGLIFWLWHTTRIVKIYKGLQMNKKDVDDFFFYAFFAVILGGRLGYVLFYNFSYYAQNPMKIFYVWEGGMAFHGAIIGIFIATLLFCKSKKYNILSTLDIILISSPFGLFLGRISNFINGELWGKITNGNWGFVFASGGNEPRHPSQLYEAFFEGLLPLVIILLLVYKTNILKYKGLVFGILTFNYGFWRFMIEFYRVPDEQLGYLTFGLTMGQILTIPLLIAGAFYIFKNRNFFLNKSR